MAVKAKTEGRYICRQQDVDEQCGVVPSDCAECGAPFPHIREEWVQKGQRIPRCDHHQAKLVPA